MFSIDYELAELMMIHHMLTGKNTKTKSNVATNHYLDNFCLRIMKRCNGYKPGDKYGDSKYLQHELLPNYNVDFLYPWVSIIQTRLSQVPSTRGTPPGKTVMLAATLRSLRYLLNIGLRVAPFVMKASGVSLMKLFNKTDLFQGDGFKEWDALVCGESYKLPDLSVTDDYMYVSESSDDEEEGVNEDDESLIHTTLPANILSESCKIEA